MLDGARLTEVLTNPGQHAIFKIENESDFSSAIVTLLIDNSSSMRGNAIMTAALCADILARALEQCDVKVEILGFTTLHGKNGVVHQRWLSDGAPPNPGRLNALRHIIYKAADVPMRQSRNNLGLMLQEGLLKENIDGEALLWAARRLSNRREQRKMLIVVSDGAPSDNSS